MTYSPIGVPSNYIHITMGVTGFDFGDQAEEASRGPRNHVKESGCTIQTPTQKWHWLLKQATRP